MSATALDATADVRAHYASIRDEATRADRRSSPVYALRCVNNWVKRVAIERNARGARRVLDLCGGRGGDMYKWRDAGATEYVLVDVSREQVDGAAQRWQRDEKRRGAPSARGGAAGALHAATAARRGMRAYFACADAFGPCDALREAIVAAGGGGAASADGAVEPFDVISCQMALHYACNDAGRLANALANVSALLRDGGTFLCSTLDAARVVGLCWPPPSQPPLPGGGVDGAHAAAGDGRYAGRAVHVEFDERDYRLLPPFGARYVISVGERVQACPEYLVHAPTFIAMAQRSGALHLAEAARFDEVCARVLAAEPFGVHAQQWRALVPQRTIATTDGQQTSTSCPQRLEADIDDEQWRVVSLYCMLTFRKQPVPFLARGRA